MLPLPPLRQKVPLATDLVLSLSCFLYTAYSSPFPLLFSFIFPFYMLLLFYISLYITVHHSVNKSICTLAKIVSTVKLKIYF